MTSGKLGSNKNSSLKIFGASESMDKTPTNCIPRLCTLTVSKMVLTKPINVELSSVYLVIKMAHSRRTIRSTEININSSSSPVTNKELMNESSDCSPSKQAQSSQQQTDESSGQDTPKEPNQPQAANHTIQQQLNESISAASSSSQQATNQQQSPITSPNATTQQQPLFAPLSPEQQLQQHLETLQLHTIELDTKIIFTFQYPHFLKKGSNQLQIMIQRRKKYKNRAILGFKTLAIGYINLAEVFVNGTNVNNSTNASTITNLQTVTTSSTTNQQSQNSSVGAGNAISDLTLKQPDLLNTTTMNSSIASATLNSSATIEPQPTTTTNITNITSTSSTIGTNNLISSYSIHPELKVDLKCCEMVKKTQSKPHQVNKSQLLMANIVVSSICLEPVSQENRRQKSIDRCVAASVSQQQESEDEEFFNWNEENSDTDGAAEQSTSNQTQEPSNSARQKLNKWRRQMNSRKARKLFTSIDKNTDEQQRNFKQFKQRLIALIRKFRIPDSANFDSPEQYEAALERELINNVVDNAEDDQDIEDLLAASVNLDEQDVCLDDLDDDLSDYSAQEFDDCLSISSTAKPSLRPFFSTCTLVGPDADDDLKNYVKKHIHEEELEDVEEENQPEEVTDSTDIAPKNKKWNEKRSKLLAKTTNYITMKDRKSLMAIINLLAKHKNRNFLPKESDTNLKKCFFEQLEKAFPDESNPTTIPEQISFIQSNEFNFIPTLKEKLIEINHTVIETSTFLEMKTTFSYLINRIQKFCNCNSRAPSTIKICIFGSDGYVNTVLRAYVEYLSNKSPEWQSYMRFYPIPLCNTASTLSHFLGTLDAQYQANFCNGKWKDLFDTQNQINLIQELIVRVKLYLNSSTTTIQIPIAESMIMYKTVQAFVPFICSVKIGFQSVKTANISIEDKDDKQETQSSSPPNNSNTATNKADLQNVVNSLNNSSFQNSITGASCANGATATSIINENQQQQLQQSSPPNSPGTQAVSSSTIGNLPFSPTTAHSSTQANTSFNLLNNGSNLVSPDGKLKESKETSLRDREECLDLQIDYWTTSAKQLQSNSGLQLMDSKKSSDISNKTTLKSTFRTLQISRLPCSTTETTHLTSPSLTLSYLTKEKKQKIMRLGKKKERDLDNRSQVVEGIHRLVCSYKNSSLKVNVDGVDWSGVKFFQLTAQWQTIVKTFPVGSFGIANEFQKCSLQTTSIPKSNR